MLLKELRWSRGGSSSLLHRVKVLHVMLSCDTKVCVYFYRERERERCDSKTLPKRPVLTFYLKKM